MRLLVNKVTA